MNRKRTIILLWCLALGTAGYVTHRATKLFSPEPVAETSPVEAPAHQSSSHPVAASNESAAITMRVSAYCPGPCCCGKWADGTTASGIQAVGKIVAAPSTIPFGTVLDIPGYGVASVQDRGGAITGNRLDVLFPTHAEAKAWGVQWLEVRIVE